MGSGEAVQILNHMLFYVVVIAGPIMLCVFAVGLLINIFQVATQLQEMTLSYIPKLISVAVILVAIGPWMLQKLVQFATETYKFISISS